MSDAVLDISIKDEPEDPLVENEAVVLAKETDGLIIPKEFRNGVHDDSDCEDMAFFTQVEVENTRKCLENTRLIIKDFETQLDWHLQQYMTLRNMFNKGTGKDDKRDDHLSIAQLSALIANHPEGNKNFIKRKTQIGSSGKRRRKNKTYDSEDGTTDFSDEDSEEEFDENFEDSEDMDDPKGKKTRGRKRKADDAPEVKDEIEEEEHELIEPKMERDSEDDMDKPLVKKVPTQRGRKPGNSPKKVRGKKAENETVDLTNLRSCKVVLDRLSDEHAGVKNERVDKDELADMLKSKAITELKNFTIDSEKPIAILRQDNFTTFDFNECKTSNVLITFEDKETLPDFIYNNNVAKLVLSDDIIMVQGSVFDEHLAEDKN